MSPAADLLAMLDASPSLVFVPRGQPGVPNAVYDGYVDADETAKVISVPLPYVVFYSAPGRDNDARQSGQVAGRVIVFQLTGVGETREQAEWVLDKARTVLSRKRLNGNLIIRDDLDQLVGRADDYTQPGGGPLFYGVDRYGVAVTVTV